MDRDLGAPRPAWDGEPPPPEPGAASGSRTCAVWQNTLDETRFGEDLNQTGAQRRTSSPVDFKSFIRNSMHPDTSDKTETQSLRVESPADARGPLRLLGEIAFQLDRRILSHVFQGHSRFYGFTLLNVPAKILEVSTHPVTGKVDEGYRRHLSRRHGALMARLSRLGYKPALHPAFSEFVVNTYGILKERPGKHSARGGHYNCPDFLRGAVVNAAPIKLQRDLLVILLCLCHMAEKDRRPLLLW